MPPIPSWFYPEYATQITTPWVTQFLIFGLSNQHCWLSTQQPVSLSPFSTEPHCCSAMYSILTFKEYHRSTNVPISRESSWPKWIGMWSICPIRLKGMNYILWSRVRFFLFSAAGHKQEANSLIANNHHLATIRGVTMRTAHILKTVEHRPEDLGSLKISMNSNLDYTALRTTSSPISTWLALWVNAFSYCFNEFNIPSQNQSFLVKK